MLSTICQSHGGMRARVHTGNGEFSEWFTTKQGLCQGCFIALLLFSIFTAVLNTRGALSFIVLWWPLALHVPLKRQVLLTRNAVVFLSTRPIGATMAPCSPRHICTLLPPLMALTSRHVDSQHDVRAKRGNEGDLCQLQNHHHHRADNHRRKSLCYCGSR